MSRRGRTADIIATTALLLVDFVLASISALIVYNTLDRCNSGEAVCPDGLGTSGVLVGLGFSSLIFVGVVIWSVRRLRNRRLSYFIALTGCSVHVALVIITSVMSNVPR